MKKQLFILLLLLPFLLFSQKKRPTVGLVLSGGGAKGFAHIGILKEIERAGIKLDYIGGTSMGAVIGGLYAAGYNAAQLEEIIIYTDFLSLIQDKVPRKSKPFFEKQSGEKHAIVLPIENGAIGLPKGASKGQNILNFLTISFAPVDTISDFKKLPIPFFCIATNVENGEPVLIEKGSMALALRASGSFPTIFHPVELNNLLLIDGGVANNFPVDVMRTKGVDIIIGVDVQGELYKKNKLNSVIDILNQVVSYKMYANNQGKINMVDVYIKPDISTFSVVSFDKGIEILKKGDEAAIAKRNTFDSIAKLQNIFFKKPKLLVKDQNFLVENIHVNGNQNFTRAYVLGTLKLSVGDSISYKKLSNKINKLTATDNFDRIDYSFKNATNGKEIILNVIETNSKAYLKLGIHYDLLYKPAVLINYSTKNILLKNDVISADFIIGENFRYNFDYFVDNGFYTSFGFKSRYNRLKTDIKFNNLEKTRVTYRDFTNKLYVQTAFNRKFSVGFGAEHKRLYADTETVLNANGTPFVYDKSDYFSGYAFLKLDTYDDKDFMTKGFYADLGFKWYLASSDFNNNFHQFSQAQGKIGFATPIGKKWVFKYESEAGFSLGSVTSTIFDFSLGGVNQNYINTFVPFYGYDIAGLSDQTFLKSLFLFRYQFVENHYVRFIANYARLDGNVFKGIDIFKGVKKGYAIGYSVDTFIGPVEFTYGWSPDTKQDQLSFNFGFWF